MSSSSTSQQRKFIRGQSHLSKRNSVVTALSLPHDFDTWMKPYLRQFTSSIDATTMWLASMVWDQAGSSKMLLSAQFRAISNQEWILQETTIMEAVINAHASCKTWILTVATSKKHSHNSVTTAQSLGRMRRSLLTHVRDQSTAFFSRISSIISIPSRTEKSLLKLQRDSLRKLFSRVQEMYLLGWDSTKQPRSWHKRRNF